MPTGSSPRPRQELVLFGLLFALAMYVCVLAGAYYFRLRSVQRHHLESAWMWLIVAAALAAFSSPRSRRDEEAEDRPNGLSPFLPVAAVVAAIALYYPALRIGFLSDDFALSDMAARNQFFGQSWAFLRPLPLVFFKIAGVRPWVMHALIVMLHGLNAALVVHLACIFRLSRRQAGVAGLLFLAFPASLEAVAWCAGIQDVLMTTGVLAAVIAATLGGAAFSLAALTAALFSKETAVAAPFLIWLSNRTRWRAAGAALGVAGAYAVWRLLSKPLTDGYAAPPSSYKLKELLVRPFGTLAVPFRGAQIAESPWLGTLLVCGLALLLVRMAWLWRGDRRRLLVTASLAAWVLVSIAPVYSMFDVSGTLQGSRYVYLATAGWSILLAGWLMPAYSRADLVLVIAVCLLGVVGVRLNLVPWTRAARMRDELLSAVNRATADGCTAVWIRNVPDSVQGAYVFRNGLAEAIAPTALTSAAPPQCWVSVPFSARN